MTIQHGPIFEIAFSLEDDLRQDFEAWIAARLQVARDVSGVLDSHLSSSGDDASGRIQFACQFVLENDEALDEFIDGCGADITAEAANLFADKIDVSDRVLREDKTRDIESGDVSDCLNCSAHLRGQYCGHCGQRSGSRLISLWELVRDAFGDLFEIDSRLWNTLVPLLLRPGLLTHDYLMGRRARYMPPFRMYLVLSLLFFLVAFFNPQEKLGLLFEPEPDTAADVATGEAEEADASSDDVSEIDEVKQEILQELAAEGIILGSDALPEDLADDDGNVHITFDDSDSDCADIDQSDVDDMPAWLARRLTIDRLNHICEQVTNDDGRALLDNLLENVPAALIILLPLMALVLKGLYPLSRRYYVEHLLFFVHFHAFFFLVLTLQILFSRFMTMVSAPEAITVLILVASSFYVPVYLFVSMRKVYGQSRLVTSLKYVVLVIAYLIGIFSMMLGALAIAAFSI